jgi:hypothetical protein
MLAKEVLRGRLYVMFITVERKFRCQIQIQLHNLICNLNPSHRLLYRWRAIEAMPVIINATRPKSVLIWVWR